MVEVEQSVANERLSDQKPFIIRGHHLIKFAFLIKDAGTTTPQELAETSRITAEILAYASPSNFTPDVLKRRQAYGHDVIGTTRESANQYEGRLKIVFEKFISLPDNHPAEIVGEMPDVLCEACIVGQHCRQVTRGEDGENIDAFLRKISLLNLPEPVIINEQLHFANSEPKQVRRVKTTLGTVKKVLKEGRSDLW